MGGGTGTGAAPVVARAVRELGVLTVGVVTKPFHFEGDRRMKQADRGIEELQSYVDTLIVIPNQNLFRVATERTTFAQAFAMADEVLHSGVRGITDLIVMPGLINRDFADIKTVMSEMGKAMMGTGECDGENRALRAAEAAISNPLLDEVSMKGARSVLVNVTGGVDLMLFEVDEAVNRIRAEVDPDANILFGSALSETMEGRVRVSVVATGIEAEAYARATPDNVQLFKPRGKISLPDEPLMAPAPRERSPRAESVSPVHRQVEHLAHGLNARAEAIPAPAPAVATHHVVDSPAQVSAMAEQAVAERIAEARAEAAAQALSEFHAPKQKRGGLRGFFGGSPKRDTRAAAPAPAAAQAPRAPAPQQQPAVTVPAAEGTMRVTAEPRTQPSDDLFSGVTEEDRFEIPAFLRRQGNSVG
jgi:cell division protein FtsZ